MTVPHSYTAVSTDHQLHALCARLAEARQIALDTEFVSERSYRPELCLVQVSHDGEMVLIDPLTIKDMQPFWEALASPGHETIVHAGRGEVEFCMRSVGRPPANLFDVQIAAGLVGIEYPAGYGTLLSKLLGIRTSKHETRTDWHRRPLSQRQIQYALDDIRHLPPMREALHLRLQELGRLGWLEQETAAWQRELQEFMTQERWRRVSGSSGLSPRSQAILRELWRWREGQAERRNCPARRMLRDDLMVELARRQTADLERIQAVRGLERGDLKRLLPGISQAIQRGIEAAVDELPPACRTEPAPHLSVLGQFLFSALGSICRRANLSPGMVGTPNDVRDLIAFRMGQAGDNSPPALATGWRAEIVGQVFDDLLAGRLTIRIGDPLSESPLIFEPYRR